jgi:hypothetical protein
MSKETYDGPITMGRLEPGIGSVEPIKWKTISKVIFQNLGGDDVMYEVDIDYRSPARVLDIVFIQENELTGELRKVKVSEL